MKTMLLALAICAHFSIRADVLLRDIGIVGLMSHDLFTWDHEKEINLENGRLDLSTIFDYEGGQRWAKGGNPKNGENSPVWTITKELVDFHKQQLKLFTFEKSRKLTILKFQGMLKKSFTRLSGLPFPTKGIDQKVNNTEQAALRALHDILPGRVRVYRGPYFPIQSFKLTSFLFRKFLLTEKELNQVIPYFDGKYAKEYQHINLPFTQKFLNLQEIDGKFIQKFSPYKQEDMLKELKKVGVGQLQIHQLSFIHNLSELVAKGMCPIGNQWMSATFPCE